MKFRESVIFGVVLINAVIGFIQEGKAERALEAVHAMLASRAMVLRDGERHEIDAGELVPGDVVLIESGTRVPADLRLLSAKNLRIDESALTGESVPVDKDPAPVADAAPLAERGGMAYAGAVVAVVIYGLLPLDFAARSAQALGLNHLLVGLAKGTVYALLVGLAGCMNGLASGRSAQAVGQATTQAVVRAIVWIVAAASLMTVLLQRLDW